MKTLKLIVKWWLIIAILYVLIFSTVACHSKSGEISRRERFLECSKNEGDAGCDSCYYLIYGYHIDPYTGEKIK